MKKILLFIGFVLLMIPAFAQVSGTVFDENNNTLPGVNVIIKGTTTGVVSGLDGNFSIEVKKGDVLSFRYVGYQNQDVTVESLTKKYNVYLKTDVVNMDEVVVMGYSNKTKTKRSILDNSDATSNIDDLLCRFQGILFYFSNQLPAH